MADENKRARRYFLWAAIGTVAWILIFVIYFLVCRKLFTRMFPHELGEFLAGWSMLLAVIWALVGVIFQKSLLSTETAKSQQESDKLKLDAARAELEHWLEQLGKEIQVLVRTCEKCELHKCGEESQLLSNVVGDYQICAGIANSKNYQHLLSEVGNGLQDFVDRVKNQNEDWIIGSDDDELADLAAVIDALKSPISKIIKAKDAGAISTDAPDKSKIDKFLEQINNASELVNGILAEYKTLGGDPKKYAETPSQGAEAIQRDQPKPVAP